MEWVEVTGKSIDEARERALDQLGVAESDAEVQIISEPKSGLFGRVRGEARIRARVAPSAPRPKRARGGRSKQRSGQGQGGRSNSGEQRDRGDGAERAPRSNGQGGRNRGGRSKAAGAAAGAKAASTGGASQEVKEEAMAEGVTLEEQAAVAKEFLDGLVTTMGLTATVVIRPIDEDTVELAVDGDELGMLVGPRGTTLAALQDVTRTVVQGRYPTKTDRILVDVARYRERRAEALTRFTQEQVTKVLETGDELALEPMSPADRKVVHDAVNALDGVSTRSEGEDAHRHVVIAPSSS